MVPGGVLLLEPCPFFFPQHRPSKRRQSGAWVHLEDVRGTKSRPGEGHLLTHYLCHRHGEHSLCLRCCKGHHSPVEFKGIQPRLVRSHTHLSLDLTHTCAPIYLPSPLVHPSACPSRKRRHEPLCTISQSLNQPLLLLSTFLSSLLHFLSSSLRECVCVYLLGREDFERRRESRRTRSNIYKL